MLSIFIGGVGSFKRVFEFTGYGFLPAIPSAIFNAVLLCVFLSTRTQFPQFMVYAIAIIDLFLLLWSAAIWVFGVKHARNLSVQNALFTVIGMLAGLLLVWGISIIIGLSGL